MQTFHFTGRDEIERLCDAAGRLSLPQLPLLRAAADGLLNLFRIETPDAVWPARMIERHSNRPTCVLIGGDPGYGHPDPAPSDWACARRLRYWCQTGGAIIHGAAGALEHYRTGAASTLILRRLAFIETTSAQALAWRDFLACPRTLLILPERGPHPVPVSRGGGSLILSPVNLDGLAAQLARAVRLGLLHPVLAALLLRDAMEAAR